MDMSMSYHFLILLVLVADPIMPTRAASPQCRAAAETSNIIQCLSRQGKFESLNEADLCAQARLVYTCFNQTCCIENRAFDIQRDHEFSACDIDCSYTTTTIQSTTTTTSFITSTPTYQVYYTDTMATFTTPKPAANSNLELLTSAIPYSDMPHTPPSSPSHDTRQRQSFAIGTMHILGLVVISCVTLPFLISTFIHARFYQLDSRLRFVKFAKHSRLFIR